MNLLIQYSKHNVKIKNTENQNQNLLNKYTNTDTALY